MRKLMPLIMTTISTVTLIATTTIIMLMFIMAILTASILAGTVRGNTTVTTIPGTITILGRITTNINIILALIRFIINHVQKDSPNAVCIRAVIYVFPPLSTMQSAR
ncbi:hypothetical protein JCM16163A_42330 [Paenibacillus sp. YK5]